MEVVAWSAAAAAAVTAAVLAWRLRGARQAVRLGADAAAHDRARERELASAAERTRIARDMHDVVAHTLSVVVAQADGGRFAATDRPEAAVESLQTISAVSREALTEMRALLGILREGGDAAALSPQPSLADIPGLVAQVRERGLDVSYVTTGTPRPLPIGAGLVAYRIVQESLSNVLAHAGPRVQAYVQLEWNTSSLGISVMDDGRGAAARDDGQGLGIVGMRERAQLFGGTLVARPRTGGGFEVTARLPWGEAS